MKTRILHLSDLHVSDEACEALANLRRIVRNIETTFGGEAENTAILVTGDLADDGDPGQFLLVRTALDPLYRAGFPMLPIPGNHDYGTRGNHADEANFRHFKTAFFGFEEIEYPQVTELGEHILIGLNSMLDETGIFDGLLADGELGPPQRLDLRDLLDRLPNRPSDRKVIVYLHHHPFLYDDHGWFRKLGELIAHRLKDGEELMQTLTGRADMLLFGHEHRHLDFSHTALSDAYGVPHILSAGRCTRSGPEYKVRPDGTVDREVILHEGLLGREICIEDGKIVIHTIRF